MLIRDTYLLLLHFIFIYNVISEPITLTLGAATAIGAAIYYGKCYVSECCNDKYMPADFNKLQRLLDENLYGQHIAKKIIVNALKHHWFGEHVQKPLTLSFHGLPGTGKNYVTKFIQESIYLEGSKSKYVHHFMGRIHFPLQENVKEYQKNLYEWIKGNVSACDRQLFIFDEVDKMPAQVLDIIKPFIDYNDRVEKIDYKRSTFIFLSNTGSTLISNQYLQLWRDGYKRENIKLKVFENLITQGAFNEVGGFHHSDTIKSNLIDHYVPFLPMELEHVRKCIINEFRRRNVTASESQIEEVLDYVDWGPRPENLFSRTGCKRLSQKVAVLAAADNEY